MHTHTHKHTHTQSHKPSFLPCSEDKSTFGQLADSVRTNYNERFDEIRRQWGGGIMGIKARNARAKIEKLKARELSQKM